MIFRAPQKRLILVVVSISNIFILGRKHDCDSTSGFCRDKCPYTNGSYPFWRVRNADNIPFLWTIRSIQMFDSINARYPISKDPAKGYSSTYFGPGNFFQEMSDHFFCNNGLV